MSTVIYKFFFVLPVVQFFIVLLGAREIIGKISGFMHCRSVSVGGMVAYGLVSKVV